MATTTPLSLLRADILRRYDGRTIPDELIALWVDREERHQRVRIPNYRHLVMTCTTPTGTPEVMPW